TTAWLPWLRTIVGVRHDTFWADVVSDTPENSGKANAGIVSPKAGIVLGPFYNNEIFLYAGYGFHSNDARGVTITVNPPNTPDAGTPADKVPFLVRAKGAEVGWRTRPVAGLESSLALFLLHYDSEVLFVGGARTPRAGRRARPGGVGGNNPLKAGIVAGVRSRHRGHTRALHRPRPRRRPHPGRAQHGVHVRHHGRGADRLVRRHEGA